MKKKINLTEKEPAELIKMLAENREELRATRFAAAGSRAKDSSMLKKNRATVARVLTEQGRRNREAATASTTS
ncbi:MAG: 50S ribosomal protein L29 [Candidatus Paceibacterota bacterium]